MRPAGSGLRVTVTDGRGRAIRSGGLDKWLARVAPARVRGDVAVALVSDRHVQRLNRQYRRHDHPTDVLSFPASDLDGRRPRAGEPLGDIVIATGVARRQARDAGHSYNTELRILALHGLLHLLGYDHDDRRDAGRMARAEHRLRRAGGLPAGLIERSRT